jgi:uncharacterized membrane protein
MSVNTVAIDIEAPPAEVFAVLRDVEAWPEWTSSVTSIKRLGDGPFGLGSRALVLQPRLRPAVWQVTAFVEGSRFTWVTVNPGIQTEADHVIDPAGAGSRVTLFLRFSGLLAPLFSRIYRRLSQRYISLEAHGLKTRCESRAVA